MNMFIDIKDIGEITKFDRILEAKHVPLIMLEFWVNTKSKFHKKFINKSFNFIFYYDSD